MRELGPRRVGGGVVGPAVDGPGDAGPGEEGPVGCGPGPGPLEGPLHQPGRAPAGAPRLRTRAAAIPAVQSRFSIIRGILRCGDEPCDSTELLKGASFRATLLVSWRIREIRAKRVPIRNPRSRRFPTAESAHAVLEGWLEGARSHAMRANQLTRARARGVKNRDSRRRYGVSKPHQPASPRGLARDRNRESCCRAATRGTLRRPFRSCRSCSRCRPESHRIHPTLPAQRVGSR